MLIQVANRPLQDFLPELRNFYSCLALSKFRNDNFSNSIIG